MFTLKHVEAFQRIIIFHHLITIPISFESWFVVHFRNPVGHILVTHLLNYKKTLFLLND